MVNRPWILLYSCAIFLFALSCCQRPLSKAPLQTVTKLYDFPVPLPVQNLESPIPGFSPTVNFSIKVTPTYFGLPFPTPRSFLENYTSKSITITTTSSPTVIFTPQGTGNASRKILTPRATWVFQDPSPTLTKAATEKPPSSVPVTKVPTPQPTIATQSITPTLIPSYVFSSTPEPGPTNTDSPDPTLVPSETDVPVEPTKLGKPPTNTPKPKGD